MATNETTIKTDLPLLILRLVLGITMVMHGVQKAQMGSREPRPPSRRWVFPAPPSPDPRP